MQSRSRLGSAALVRSAAALLVAAIALPLLSPAVAAEWSVINLLPAGVTSSHVYSVQGGYQAGMTSFSGRPHACYWNGTAESWVDLDSPEFTCGSLAAGNWGSNIVGSTGELDEEENDYSRAALWLGSAANYVDLHPAWAGACQSIGKAISGNYQGGVARFNESNHAALWSGTAESFKDLHPDVAGDSYIEGMSGGFQVGYATVPLSHACMWEGTADSWVDLHPDFAFASQGRGTDGVQQVGWSIFNQGGIIDHPALWSGSAESYVDLLPSGWRDGKAIAVFEGRQVGYARPSLDIEYHALVWDGAADDYIDLHDFLPEGVYFRSTAYGIWNDGVNWYIAGMGVRPGYTSDPLLWVTPVPEPTTLTALLIAAAAVLRRR
ncbi:MAG: PEP-CTERM sorting domain-containing protein [Phycisphaerae bacterium]|jgi:hypothetical protein